MRKIKEWLSISIVKSPGLVVLLGILVINLLLFSISGGIISYLAPSTLENKDFWSCVYFAITMVLDAGCIEAVIDDVGQASLPLIITCITTVILGMIIFTGAVIGYMSNLISDFITNANSGARKLLVSGHIIILNWNSRASEIINDLLYKGTKENIVVLVQSGEDEIKNEINDRISDTIEKENIKNRLTVIVRRGDTFSTKQLNDISIKQAKSVIILGNDISTAMCKYDYKERIERMEKGNSLTIKTLVQVAELTAASDSSDDQQIIVEVDDNWTQTIVNKIIEHKMKRGKCNIVPVPISQILGQIFSQFSIMPELNMVYATLFSNKGAAFYVQSNIEKPQSEDEFIKDCMNKNFHSVPLTIMEDENESSFFYMAEDENNIHRNSNLKWNSNFKVSVNENYKMHEKDIIILGHNSKCSSIMDGFSAFRGEWQKKGEPELLNVIVIDDEESLQKQDNYRQYPYVKKLIKADIYEKDLIIKTIDEFIASSKGDISILVLSDDNVTSDEIDANVLTYLIYIQEIRNMQHAKNPDFNENSIDVVVEILNPKNFDVVHNYSIDNIVISNRYISKMVTQICEKKSLFTFYSDILTFDEEDADEFSSKEMYIKEVKDFFNETPEPCTAAELIRAVYNCSPGYNRSVLLGYIRDSVNMFLFDKEQTSINVSLRGDDKLILFSYH